MIFLFFISNRMSHDLPSRKSHFFVHVVVRGQNHALNLISLFDLAVSDFDCSTKNVSNSLHTHTHTQKGSTRHVLEKKWIDTKKNGHVLLSPRRGQHWNSHNPCAACIITGREREREKSIGLLLEPASRWASKGTGRREIKVHTEREETQLRKENVIVCLRSR